MAVHVAARKAIPSLAGLVVVDVVEVWFLKLNIKVLPINTLIWGIRTFLTVAITSGNSFGFISAYAENLIYQDAVFFKH